VTVSSSDRVEPEVFWVVFSEVFVPALVTVEGVATGWALGENVDDAAPGVCVCLEAHADHPEQPLTVSRTLKKVLYAMGPPEFESGSQRPKR
jgi:hypothetical protein